MREQLKKEALEIAHLAKKAYNQSHEKAMADLIERQDKYIDELEKERARWEALAGEWHRKFFKATDKTEIAEQGA